MYTLQEYFPMSSYNDEPYGSNGIVCRSLSCIQKAPYIKLFLFFKIPLLIFTLYFYRYKKTTKNPQKAKKHEKNQ